MSDNTTKQPIGRKCRIKPITGITAFAECLEPDSHPCSYALSFAYGKLCTHPDWQQMMIVEEGKPEAEK